MPLSRLLHTLFGSHLPKLPSLIGRGVLRARIVRLPGLVSAICRFQADIRARFKADARARFVGRMRAPGRPAEPQPNGGEQGRYCQEQMFSSHCFLLCDSR